MNKIKSRRRRTLRQLLVLVSLIGTLIPFNNCAPTLKTQGSSENASGSSTPPDNGIYTYSWNVGAWQACSATACGTSGTQSRSVSCLRSDNAIVGNELCSGAVPASSQICSAPACPPPPPPVEDTADLTIAFPPPGATSESHIVVRGRTLASLNVTLVRVTNVSTATNVNATTSDNFANWRADVPLQVGTNNLRVDMTENGVLRIGVATVAIQRFSTESAITRGSNSWSPRLMRMGYDAINNRILTTDADDDGVYEMDMDNGNRRAISNLSGLGSGPPEAVFSNPTYIVARDNACYVVDNFMTLRILSVDLITGNRVVRSVPPVEVTHLSLSADGSTMLGLGHTNEASSVASIVSIHPTTGAVTTVASNATGSGPVFRNDGGMAVSWARNTAYVMGYSDRFLAVNLSTGVRTSVFARAAGEPTVSDPNNIVVDDVTQQLFVADSGRLVAIDLNTGARRIIGATGTLSSLNSIRAIAMTPWGPAIADARPASEVSSPRSPTIFVIDPIEGTRIVVGR